MGFAGHAFRWTQTYGLLDLGTLGGLTGEATAINESEQIVGFSDTPAGTQHAFLWISTYGIADLNDLIPPGSGWELIEAHGINSDGEIVGWGFHNGNKRAFLLTTHPLVIQPPPLAPPTGLTGTVH
jgi:probable HAF family extracellular repeat protein